jgi:hypothetical protein
MLRTLVLTVFLVAWLATGIISGVVMGRRHDRLLDRFLWSLLGAASGALLVPLALGAGRREEPSDQPTSPLGRQDRPLPVLVAIDDSQAAAAAPYGGLLDRNGRRDDHDNYANPDRPGQGRAASAERSSAERARRRPRVRTGVVSGK